jgi:hypothetical protein
MKINLKKKTLIVSIILFLVIAVSLFIFFFVNNKTTKTVMKLDKYEEFLTACTLKNSFTKLDLTCEGLLGAEYVNENDLRCLTIIYLDENDRRVASDICEDSDNVLWSNPYDEQDLSIPVEFKLNYVLAGFGKYNFKNMELTLLDDEKAYELLDIINGQTSNAINIITQEYAEIKENNWYVTRFGDENMETKGNLLAVNKAKIVSYGIDGDNLILTIEAVMNDEIVIFEANATSITYSEIVNGEENLIIVDKDNVSSAITFGFPYYILLSVSDKTTFDESFIEEYINNPRDRKDISFIIEFILKQE